MKKIFTLLFFAGFLTTGFAQSRRGQDSYQNNGDRNQNYGYSKSYPAKDVCDNDRDYSYNRDRDNDRDRGYDRDRDDWNRRNEVRRGHDHYDVYDNRPVRQSAPRRGGSLLQIILSGTIRL